MSAETLGRRVGRGLGWSAAGNIVVRLVNVATSILMARLIAPDEFGVFAVAFTVWVIVGTVSEFGLGADLVRAEDPDSRAPTIATLALGLGVVLAVTMAWTAAPVATAFGSADSADVIRLMALSAVVMGLAIVPSARMQRDFRQAGLFAINLVSGVVSTATIVLLAVAGAGAFSLAWGQLVGQAALVVGLLLVTRSRPRFGLDRQVARDAAAFCLPLAAANVLSWLLLTVDNLVVARILDPQHLGLYVLAFNVSSWPMSAVGQALRSVALPAFSQLDHGRRRNGTLVGVTGPVVAAAGFVVLLLATMSGAVVELLYGARWAGAAAALVGLAVFGGVRVVFDVVVTFLIAVGTTADVLVVQVVWLLAMVPAMAWGVAHFGIAGAGWAHVVVALVVVLPAYLMCLRRVGVDPVAFLGAWLRPAACLVPAALVCTWIGRQDTAPIVLLAAGGLAATLLYAVPMAPWCLRQVRSLRAAPAPASATPPTPAAPNPEPIGQDA